MKQVFGVSKLENQINQINPGTSSKIKNLTSGAKSQSTLKEVRPVLPSIPEDLDKCSRDIYKPIDTQFMQLYESTLCYLEKSLEDRLPVKFDDVNSDFLLRFRIPDEVEYPDQPIHNSTNMITEAPFTFEKMAHIEDDWD